MKVRDLLEEINQDRKEYGDEFLDWEVYTEQLDETDKRMKKTNLQWKWITDSEEWQYCECAGWWTKFPKEKVFTININY